MSEHEVSRYLRESSARLAAALQRRFAGNASGEDAVQEALIRAWQLTAAGTAIGSWDRWIAVTATNVARMQLRSRQAENRALTGLSAQTPTEHWPEPFQHLGPVARGTPTTTPEEDVDDRRDPVAHDRHAPAPVRVRSGTR